MQLGFIGLGKMGNRMVMKLLAEGHHVVVYNRTKEKVSNFKFQISNFKYKTNLTVASSIEDLATKLQKPRIIWSMLPAGAATEVILFGPKGVATLLSEQDILIDGGNSNFRDTQRRWELLKSRNIKFLGIGVSGGVIAFEDGYPLMAGGSKDAYEQVTPILDSLAKPGGGHEYFGQGGAGHFVKMVHNGIEYGVMQAIGEGFGVMEKSPYDLDLLKVAKLYQKGTLNSGFMMARTIESLQKDPKLNSIVGYIEDSGEGQWTIEQAKEEGVPINVIEESLEFRRKSREDESIANTFAAKLVAALRNAFGGHEVKKK